MHIAIIGAGLTGIILAKMLQERTNHKVTVFEKSRGAGRIATRYRQVGDKTCQWGHGAQFFTIKTEQFRNFMHPYIAEESLQRCCVPWHANVAQFNAQGDITQESAWGDDQPRYVSYPKMTTLARKLATALVINHNARVETLIHQQGLWRLYDDQNQSLGDFDWVVCTAPPEQAKMLLPTDFCHHDKVASTQMQACFSLMVGWQQPPEQLTTSSWEVAYVNDSSINMMVKETSKPRRHNIGYSVTIQADNVWSNQNVDVDMAQIQTKLVTVASQLLGIDISQADHIDLHRWRYAKASTENTWGCLIDKDMRLLAAGDWCLDGRIESSYHSAVAAFNNFA